jgi:protein ImuB
MARLACVNAPNLALQLLLKRHPEWNTHPVAVVTKESPFAAILSVNRRARSAGILPGMRYAAGLSLASGLRAGPISRWEIEEGVTTLTQFLQGFSPEVEPSRKEAGIFWLDIRGLTPLYSSLDRWIGNMAHALAQEGIHIVVAAGYTRFGSYAAAKTAQQTVLFASEREEREAAMNASIEILTLKSDLLERLKKLGLSTVGSFLRLPSGGVRRRFGEEAEKLHHFAAGELAMPLQPVEARGELKISKRLLVPENDWSRLLFHMEECLDCLLPEAETRQELVTEIHLTLIQEDASPRYERLRPAAPTLDRSLILELIHLRLRACRFASGIEGLALSLSRITASNAQLELFRKRPHRDLAAGARAFARLRAYWGAAAIQRVRLAEAHLPERSFSWENMDRPVLPTPMIQHRRIMMRRLYNEPLSLSKRQEGRPSGTLEKTAPETLKRSRIRTLTGPYVVSGHWWAENFYREYYYGESAGGDLQWIYYDRLARNWMLSGFIE